MAKVYIENVRDLVEKAGEIREKLALATRRIGNVHIGGPMSATDVTTAIYYKYMGFDPENLDDPNRDRFILSKGHNGILLFTIFCDMGMYDWDLLLDTYNTIGHPFGAHPNHKRVKGIEVSTGSLGHGLSWCCGIGHANRGRGIKSRIWTLLGDGEMEEGSNWEAILYAASHNLDNIVAVVDFNHASAAYETNQNERWGEKGGPEGMADCFRAFGWNATVIDGTDMKEIDKTLAALPEASDNQKELARMLQVGVRNNIEMGGDHSWEWKIGGGTMNVIQVEGSTAHVVVANNGGEIEPGDSLLFDAWYQDKSADLFEIPVPDQLEQELVIDLDESAYENKYCCWQTATITPISFRLDGRYGSSWSSPKTNNAVSITLKDGTSFDLANTENGYADSAYGTYGSMSSSGTGMPEADRVKHTWLFSQLIDLADLASITVDGVTYPVG